MRVAFNRREKQPTTGPYIFIERLAHHFNGRKDIDVVRAGRYHDVHMITIHGSGRRADQYGAKKILRVDGVYYDAATNPQERNSSVRDTYHNVDGIIYQCEFARRMIHKHFGLPRKAKHETIIFNGVSGNFKPIQDGVEYHDFGYPNAVIASAKWRPDKRLNTIIDGFLAIKRDDVVLGIFGNVPEDEQIEHHRIKYYGFVPPQDMWQYYASATVLLHPAYVDWCPNCVVEALRCGTPVITTHNGGVPELIRGCGAIIKGDPDYDMEFFDFRDMPQVNPELVADTIELFLDIDKESYCKDRPDLSIENCGDQYVEFFKKVME